MDSPPPEPTPAHAPALLDDLTLLAEPLRVRLLRLAEAEELTVGELARILQVAQSTASRHAKALHVGGWLVRRVDGASTRLRLEPEALTEASGRLWALVRDRAVDPSTLDEDRRRLDGVLAQRRIDSRAYFAGVAARWSSVRRELYGERFGMAAMAALAVEGRHVLDLGCGTGELTCELSRWADHVTAVDRSRAMLDAARARLGDGDGVTFIEAELETLPLGDGAAGAALMTLVLHHLEAPERAVAEALRVLAPGAPLVVTDMEPHEREAYRHTMGHVHLGFSTDALGAVARAAGGRVSRRVTLPADPAAQGPGLFVAVLRRD